MELKVIDKKTGLYPDIYNIALNEEWAKDLIYCDMEGFFINEEGTLALADECGHFVYCPADRFEVKYVSEEEPEKIADSITKIKENENIIEELEYSAELIAKLLLLCTPEQKDRDKLFRRFHPGPGDYMGTGYAFLDAFDKISNYFYETSSNSLYQRVAAALYNEVNKKDEKED